MGPQPPSSSRRPPVFLVLAPVPPTSLSLPGCCFSSFRHGARCVDGRVGRWEVGGEDGQREGRKQEGEALGAAAVDRWGVWKGRGGGCLGDAYIKLYNVESRIVDGLTWQNDASWRGRAGDVKEMGIHAQESGGHGRREVVKSPCILDLALLDLWPALSPLFRGESSWPFCRPSSSSPGSAASGASPF